ncbi:adenine-specific DNA-methyltransferase [uncultured Oceanisphaera sp.]|uniref:adenine-specific DNA-methyltransferase n=1 Tax=uncultured Oceanisphaera sp. TaxID=353858 RepID=UPI00261257C9|nr:adenine-specific DNA-methyltransferase [uncultured Oceanisphaera sp.]
MAERFGVINQTFSDENHKIIHGDVLLGLKEIHDESVDLIFADPPYNIGKDFDGLKEKWTEKDFLAWCYEWINDCFRVLKPHGTFYLMNSTENMPFLDIYCRNLFTIKSRVIWSYDSSGVQAKTYFGSMYEPILMLTKHPKNYTFNHDDILVEAKTGAKRQLIDYRKNPPQPYNTKKVPGNVWEFPRVRFKMDEYENHPTQKPESLLERVIKASSNEGDLVLDPFSGSFSTGAVAKKFHRKFVGIEINEDYVKIGIRKLELTSDYSEEELAKEKKRKTKNLSKKVREKGSDAKPTPHQDSLI